MDVPKGLSTFRVIYYFFLSGLFVQIFQLLKSVDHKFFSNIFVVV